MFYLFYMTFKHLNFLLNIINSEAVRDQIFFKNK